MPITAKTYMYCDVFVQVPQTEHEWKLIASDFWIQWQFPNCLGALDGKHVHIVPPANCGSLYYNYKQFNSIVLLALVDAQYRFLYVDIGSYGRISDGGVYNSSSLSAAIQSNALHIPPDSLLPHSNISCPYVLVADDAFGLSRQIMKPYTCRNLSQSQRIYNYRLSRSRRVVENAFGIMSSRFRVFGKAIAQDPDKVQTIVMAACCLHNFLLRNPTSAVQYLPDDCDTQSNLQSVAAVRCNRPSNDALAVRVDFERYFNSEAGAVSWQTDAINYSKSC